MSRPELTSFLVLEILPALESSEVGHIPLAERLQLLDAFDHAGKSIDGHPDVARYWVPAAALGRQCLEDQTATVSDLVRLGYLFENQLALLTELKARGKLPAADASRLGAELEDRLRATWTKVVGQDPKAPAGHIGLALAHYRAGQADEAVATLSRGLEACGERVELLAAFADLTRRRDPQAGLDLLMKSVRRRPNELVLWRLAADTAAAASRPDLALVACDEALRLRPGEPWACRLRGGLLLAQGRAAEAKSALSRSGPPWPRTGRQPNCMSRPCVAPGPWRASSLCFVKSPSGRSHCPDCLAGAGHSSSLRGPNKQVRGRRRRSGMPPMTGPPACCSRTVCGRGPSRTPPRNGIRTGFCAAVRAYEWLWDHDRDDLAVANNLAWLHLKGERLPATAEASAAPLRTAEAAGRDLPSEVLETLGAIDLEIGQPERTARLLEKATRISGERAGHWIHLGRAYLMLARPADAGRCFDRAAALPRSVRETDELAAAVHLWRNPPRSRAGMP